MVEKILITGASGMLGRMVFETFSRFYEDASITTLSRSSFENSDTHVQLDLSNLEAVSRFLNVNDFDVLVHCAAFVNLAYCKENPEKTKRLHIKAPELLSRKIKKAYYISTDSVFDGQKGKYSETDETNPLNLYAETKHQGERAVMENAFEAFIIRCNIFGFHVPLGKSLFEWAYQELLQGKKIKGFSNVMFNPLYTGNLAEMLVQFHKLNPEPGKYHFGCEGSLSKYDFLVKVAATFGFNQDIIKPVELDPVSLGERRPLNTSLNTTKLERAGVNVPGIEECLKELQSDFNQVYENGQEF